MPKIYYTSEGYKIEVAKVTLDNYGDVAFWLLQQHLDVSMLALVGTVQVVPYLVSDNHLFTSCEGMEECTKDNPVYIFRNLEPNHPELNLDKCTLVNSETFAKMDLREPHYLMQLFTYKHLPTHLQEVSKPICELAEHLDKTLPNNPEKTTALRKLREAKDCAVTAVLFKN